MPRMLVVYILKFHFLLSTRRQGIKRPSDLSSHTGFEVERVEVSLWLYCSDSSFTFCSALGKTPRK